MATNIFLSLELIYLIKWILKHDKTRLRTIIKEALDNGLATELDHLDSAALPKELKDDEILPHIFLDLLVFLEKTLFEDLDRKDENREIQETLLTTMNQLNIKDVTHDTLWTSIKQAKKELTKNNTSKQTNDPEFKNTLLKKYLKNWKPNDHDSIN